MKFEVRLQWEVVEGDKWDLVVKGIRQPFVPESKVGDPDTWTPAEGGELEDVEIFSTTENGEFELLPVIAYILIHDEKFMKKVAEKILS